MSNDPDTTGRWHAPGFVGDADATAETAARRGNRRRLLVFGLTFLVALLVGQVWNFSRPAEFRTSTRVQVNLPEVGRPGQSASAAFGTKLQLFDSRPMLARLAEALGAAGLPSDALGADPAQAGCPCRRG